MFLKSVTLRGFKSFAEKTKLEFEPGITVVVGPNGSGKSNIVDALTWVLGTSSAKSLRGGSMSDVIFAGAPGRAALGHAAVEIDIDNASGTLPIDFSEVTVSRSMYASGENDYAINGVDCRLLDVAELLSDTGLGRENHTIVGQGRLDAILNARPEERRAFIEEAAGILKHRRRKERALRKLRQTEEHLERSTDILRELRRQLRPLERQAEAAARHDELRARRDEIRRTRGLRELDALTARLDSVARDDERLAADVDARTAEVTAARRREADIEAALAESEPLARRAAEIHVRLSTVVERFRGLIGRIEERRHGLVEAVEEPVAGRDPTELRAEADTAEQALARLVQALEAAQGVVEERARARGDAERARRAHDQAAAAEARRRAEARERQLRWEGQVGALRSALAQARGEEGRLAAQIQGLEDRGTGLEADVARAQDEIRDLDANAPRLTDRLRGAEERLVRRTDTVDDLTMAERELERERASLRARAEALRATAHQADDATAAILAAADDGRLDGVLGTLSSCLEVVEGRGPAVAEALGDLGDAVVVDTRARAATAVGMIASEETGRVLLLVGSEVAAPRDAVRDAALAGEGARPIVEALDAPPRIRAALTWALRDHYLVEDWHTAIRCVPRHPECTFVTPEGQVAGARGWVVGAPSEQTPVLALAGAEEAERRLAETEAELADVQRRLIEADEAKERTRDEVDAATVLVQESDGRITAAAERLARLRAEAERCARELAERREQATTLARGMQEQAQRLADLEAGGGAPVDEEPQGPDLEAERLEDVLSEAREAEVQARLELRSVQNRQAATRRRVDELRAEADAVERQVAAREARRVARVAAVARCNELVELARAAHHRATASLDQAAVERDAVEQERAGTQEELGALRACLRELEEALAGGTARRHEAALARQELQTAVAAACERLAEVTDEEPDELLAEARRARDEGADDTPLVGGAERDEELATAERRLDRQLGLIGDVNPYARQEYERLTERHAFLEAQLADLRASRDDLLEVVDTVDTRIREVFADAFADVADAFDKIFPRLFPGGEGRLVLTDADDLLDSGVEVEARPAGKRVKRLSLLSGGERSLTALAVTFAIFAARPSPFYVLDEVEAALDDVNLQRFLDVVTDFRASSQLIIVSHQKRTMEIADVLYGVSMRSDGVSRVISQRAAELADVPA